ncbi:hypothetical protein BHM03_00020504 [Ensete ventricosum]|nr:hypothetical protein BHM03_00020504 [Ensete ventricosum]
MIDTGSSADILYKDAFKKLRLTTADLSPMSSALTGFIRDSIAPLGTTVLLVTLGQEPQPKTLMVTFMVVGLPTAYNIILRRSTLNRLKAIVSTYHRTIKFPTRAGVGERFVLSRIPREENTGADSLACGEKGATPRASM